MEETKKAKKFPWLVLVLLIAVVAAAAGVSVFFYRNTLVDGRVIPVDSVELDLRGTGITDFSGLKRCTGLRTLDLRDNDIDPKTLAELRSALPECTILYDVVVGGVRYDNSTAELTLTDLPEDWEGLQNLPLTSLTVEQCTNPAAMEELRSALPDCAMRWSLNVGGQWYDVSTDSLSIPGSAVYFEELLSQLQWFPQLQEVALPSAVLTAEQQRTLLGAYEGVAFSWPVAVGDMLLPCDTAELTFAQGETVDLAALESVLDLLPELKQVDFSDSGVDAQARVDFRAAHPDMDVSWNVTLLGETYSCDTEMLDFNNKAFSEADLAELEATVSYLPQLQKIEMCDTGLSNETLDALNQKYEDIRVIWRVYLSNGHYSLRTDDTYFWPSGQYGSGPPAVTDYDTPVLSYCTDMIALDLGHQYFTDLSFVQTMTHLKYLIIAECPIVDLSPLSSLKELVYLELFNTAIDDITPLVECTALKALNVCYIRALQDNAWAALSKMPGLEYLWYTNIPLSGAQLRQLQADNPALVTFTIRGGESSGGRWRYNQYYYDMRDALDHAWYMPSGTNGLDEDGYQIIIDDHGVEFHVPPQSAVSQYWWTLPECSYMHPYIQGVTD